MLLLVFGMWGFNKWQHEIKPQLVENLHVWQEWFYETNIRATILEYFFKLSSHNYSKWDEPSVAKLWLPIYSHLVMQKDRVLQLPLNKEATVFHTVTDISPHGQFKRVVEHMARVGRVDFHSPDNFVVGKVQNCLY